MHKLAALESKKSLSKPEKKALALGKSRMSILTGKLQLLKEYEKDPFKKFLEAT